MLQFQFELPLNIICVLDNELNINSNNYDTSDDTYINSNI